MGTDILAPSPPLRRDWSTGLRGLLRFVRGRGGLDDAYEGMLALAGPTVDREFRAFALHPVGRALLDERPRGDLNAFLGDGDRLHAMPDGSLAASYLEYMGGVGMGSADDFLTAAGIEDKARRFGWTEDQLFFVRRMANSHDLFHVLTGYGRDVVGEVGVDAFTAGQIPMLPLRLFLAYLMMLKPSTPFAWLRFVWAAYRHGRSSPSLACVDYEALFPLPLAEARQQMGIRPLEAVHADGFPTTGSWLDRIERNITKKPATPPSPRTSSRRDPEAEEQR